MRLPHSWCNLEKWNDNQLSLWNKLWTLLGFILSVASLVALLTDALGYVSISPGAAGLFTIMVFRSYLTGPRISS